MRDGHFLRRGLKREVLDHLAANLRDLPFEIAHTGLAGIEADDVTDCRLADVDFLFLQAVVLKLLGNQVPERDIDFLGLGVPRDPDDLHSVQERGRNVQGVGLRDEHDFRKIEI
jgi:hypothetical protein